MEWIPITEQPLPKNDRNLLITSGDSYVDVIYFCTESKRWYYNYSAFESEVPNRVLKSIIAWMYYPAPYKG